MSKKTLSAIVTIIIALVFGADAFFEIGLLELIQSKDDVAPVIDDSQFNANIQLGTDYDITDITCTDNFDETCTIQILVDVDTSIVGEFTLTVSATDNADNTTTKEITITIFEGVNPAMYIPDGYYEGIDGLTGDALKSVLNDIITDHEEFPYTDTTTDVWDMLRAADEDPDNPDNVILFYTGISWPKDCQDTRTDLLPDECFIDGDREADYTEWNREHIWSKSHGDFEEEDDYEFEEKDGGYALGAHTDGHHLVASERSMNSTKNNRFFEDCHDGIDDDNLVDRGYGNYTCGEWYFEPRDEVKGDVARMLFYMVIRYEGEDGDYVDLELLDDLYEYEDTEVSIKSSKLPYYEDLSTLLRWHIEDPVSEWEINRNQTIYEFQGNRNPFIDMPELVEEIFGAIS